MNIFLSYNRQNQSFVTQIANQLQALNGGTSGALFFDQDDLGSGDIWAQKIQDALVNSDVCVVFIGEQGIGNWQMKEVLEAINLLKKKQQERNESSFRIIPVIVPHSNRDKVQKSFPWFLADTQWIEFTSPSDSDAFQKLVVALRENAPTPFPIPEGINNPYKGLESFGVDDAAFFFGRTFDVNRVFYYHLRLGSNPFGKQFLAIIGNSGSGKSSFAKAGLLASLKAGRFEGSANWLQIILTPDGNPLLKLATALEKASVIAFSTDFKNSALKDPETLRERLEVFGQRVVLLIDQFEEVLTQCKDNAIRTAFLANLTEAVKSDYLVCIITMRSDFYASFAPYREFNFLLLTNPYTLTEIDANTNGDAWQRYMRDIISKPARLLGVTIEQSLINRIIDELRDINGVLPVLQLALQQLWAGRRNPDQLSTSDYDRLAGGQGRGIAGIIETHANGVYDSVTRNGTDTQAINLFKAIFIRLVETTSSKDDVRKTVGQKKLVQELASRFGEDQIQQMLLELSGEPNRLIRIKNDTTTTETWIDIIHEVLIRKWEKLKGWINEKREAIDFKKILENDISQYGNKAGSLYSGRELKTAIIWQKNNPDLTDDRIHSFITKSQTRQHTWIYGSLTAVLLAVLVGLWYNFEYLPKNTGLAKYWKERNYKLDEIHKLQITNLYELASLQAFTELDSLQIDAGGQNFNQTHLDYLPKSITYLAISNVEIVEPLTFNQLGKIEHLELINITKLQSLPSLQPLQSLQTLYLYRLDNLTGLNGIEQVKSLQTLSLSDLYKLTDLNGIEQAKSLQTLSLKGLPKLADLKGIEQVKSLQSLSLSGLAIPDLKGLEQFPTLKKLMVRNMGSGGFGHAERLLVLPLDTLRLEETNVHALNYGAATCQARVFVYSQIGVDETWIVNMAKSAPKTKFLNVKDIWKDQKRTCSIYANKGDKTSLGRR